MVGLGSSFKVGLTKESPMVIRLDIRHRTTYRYRRAVAFGQHRMMLRPRESRELRLIDFQMTITPGASVTWAYDVWGNAVATASFTTIGELMQIDSFARIELDAVAWPVFDIAVSAIVYPFQYAPDDWQDLGALTVPQYPDPAGRLRTWTRGFVLGPDHGHPVAAEGSQRRRPRHDLLSEP